MEKHSCMMIAACGVVDPKAPIRGAPSGEEISRIIDCMPTASPALNRHQLSAEIKQRAHAIGFDLVGIADASPSKYRDYLRDWLDTGQAGSMAYLGRRFEERTDPNVYLPGVRSVICVAMNYHVPLEEVAENERAHHGRIARYALGDDYHEVIKSKLFELADWMRQAAPEAQTRAAYRRLYVKSLAPCGVADRRVRIRDAVVVSFQ